MIARLVHVEWLRRNRDALDMMAPTTRAVFERSHPESKDPGTAYPTWWALTYACLCDTGTERSFGWGIGPIPWSKIVDWARLKGMQGRRLDDFVYVVRAMDAKYLELEAARMKKEQGRG